METGESSWYFCTKHILTCNGLDIPRLLGRSQIGFDSFESAKRPFCSSWGYRHSQKNRYSSVDVMIQLRFSMLECVNKCARLLSNILPFNWYFHTKHILPCNGLDIPRLLLGPCYPYLFQSLVCFIICVYFPVYFSRFIVFSCPMQFQLNAWIHSTPYEIKIEINYKVCKQYSVA
jgi:hypothetical protein